MSESKPKLYCTSMWKSVHVDVDGYLTPCCMFIHGEDKKTKITDIKKGGSIESVLIDEFQEYRDMLSEGVFPSGCNQCEFAEKEGRSSKRIQDMGWANTKHADGTDIFPTPPLNVSLEYLQLKTGRLCNLECTICTPACSSAIAARQLKNGTLHRHHYDKLQKEIEWATDLDELKKMNSQYYRIDIAGGEPLMNKEHFEWLSQLPDDQKKNTQLLYNTNGTQRPTDREVEIWSKFKGVWLTFSIDAAYEKFEKLRVNAKWDEVVANIDYCTNVIIKEKLKHQVASGGSNTAIVMTIHKGNINDIFNLYEATKDLGWLQTDFINFNYLYYPESMAIHNMNRGLLQKTLENINDNIHKLPNGRMYEETIKIKDSIIEFIDEKHKHVEEDRRMPVDHRDLIDMEDITFP